MNLSIRFFALVCILFTLNRVVADEGFIKGTYRFVKSDLPELWPLVELPFVMACDHRSCLIGRENHNEKNGELFMWANEGNAVAISAEVLRSSGVALDVDGNWEVSQYVEQKHLTLDESFESRYRLANLASNTDFSLPAFLTWQRIGVTRETMQDALKGKSYSVRNELGMVEISGSTGIGRIRIAKESQDLFSPVSVTLSEVKFGAFANGIKSIKEEYAFTPERRFGVYEPFQCNGTIEYKAVGGRTYRAELVLDVTKQGSPEEARRFIDAFIAKLPNDKAIISRSEVTTVLDKGKQKVAVDLDVARAEPAKFSNQSSFGYYALVGLGLIVVGFLAFYRWSK